MPETAGSISRNTITDAMSHTHLSHDVRGYFFSTQLRSSSVRSIMNGIVEK